MEKTRPKTWAERKLQREGVSVVDVSSGIVECDRCSRRWAVLTPTRHSRRPSGWWRCPEGCNAPE